MIEQVKQTTYIISFLVPKNRSEYIRLWNLPNDIKKLITEGNYLKDDKILKINIELSNNIKIEKD